MTVHPEARKSRIPLGGSYQGLDPRVVRQACEELGLIHRNCRDRRVGSELKRQRPGRSISGRAVLKILADCRNDNVAGP